MLTKAQTVVVQNLKSSGGCACSSMMNEFLQTILFSDGEVVLVRISPRDEETVHVLVETTPGNFVPMDQEMYDRFRVKYASKTSRAIEAENRVLGLT